jgi:menaquinone-9 beta-reductase
LRPDVLVVGGGPAGLAAAIAARLKNFRVTVVDSRKPPINKPCGEGLLPEAVEALHGLGIEVDSGHGYPFAGFRFSDEFSAVEAAIPAGRAFGLRRTALHQLLIDRAEEVGVSLLWGTRISDFSSAGARIDGNFVPCKWLIGADGRYSAVRRFARLEPRFRARYRIGFRRHYAIAPWTNFVEVHWGRKSQIVVTPTGRDEVCISLFVDDPRMRMDRAMPQFPEVARRLRGVAPISTERGAAVSFSRARGVVRGNIALVGDSGCTVDSISGQGLSLAFQQAGNLADALAAGDLARYSAAHRRITRTPVHIARLLLLMNSSVELRRRALKLFAAKPQMFADLIAVHTTKSDFEALNPAEILTLGWRVLWA